MILLVLPAATFFVRGLEEKEGQEVRIAVCVETADSDGTDGKTALLEEELLEALTKQEGDEEDADGSGLFRFYECGSEEEVKAQVASRQTVGMCFPVICGESWMRGIISGASGYTPRLPRFWRIFPQRWCSRP